MAFYSLLDNALKFSAYGAIELRAAEATRVLRYEKLLEESATNEWARALLERDFEVGVGDVVTWQPPDGLVRPEERSWQARVEVHGRDRLATTLGPYLEQLRWVEAQRPEELRRPLLGWEELAEAAAASRRTTSPSARAPSARRSAARRTSPSKGTSSLRRTIRARGGF